LEGGSTILAQKCKFGVQNWDTETSTKVTQAMKKFSKNNKLSTSHMCSRCTSFAQVHKIQFFSPKMEMVEKEHLQVKKNRILEFEYFEFL